MSMQNMIAKKIGGAFGLPPEIMDMITKSPGAAINMLFRKMYELKNEDGTLKNPLKEGETDYCSIIFETNVGQPDNRIMIMVCAMNDQGEIVRQIFQYDFEKAIKPS